MKRRSFLKSSVALSALAGFASVTTSPAAGSRSNRGREIYELRAYRLKPASKGELLHLYLETALLPAMQRMGAGPVGVWMELEPKDPATVFVLVPFKSMDDYSEAALKLDRDKRYFSAASEYLGTGPKQPAYDRVDTWILRAFVGMPRVELAEYSKNRKPRLFEMRTYESYSEAKARKKVDMFNDGEIQIMRDVGLAPVFFGEGLAGANLPHLTYMTSAGSEALHKEHWAAFSAHPEWDRMKKDPQYADTVSKITKWFLVPAAYSQI